MKIVIQKLYDCVDLTVNYNNPIMDNDNTVEENDNSDKESNNDSENNSDNDSDDESDDEEYEIIEYKGKDYILEGDKLFNINEDDSKGKIFGSYIDGKVKKIKSSEILVV